MSYGKIWLYRALIHSNVPEDPYLSRELNRYFPAPVQKRFAARIKRHRLRREIIATAITNSLINRMGPVFPVRAQDDTGADPAAIARAYSIAREVFAARHIWSQIEALDNRIPAAVQYTAMFQMTRLLRLHELLAAGESAQRSGHQARGICAMPARWRSCSTNCRSTRRQRSRRASARCVRSWLRSMCPMRWR